jgi:hypothetical protein
VKYSGVKYSGMQSTLTVLHTLEKGYMFMSARSQAHREIGRIYGWSASGIQFLHCFAQLMNHPIGGAYLLDLFSIAFYALR